MMNVDLMMPRVLTALTAFGVFMLGAGYFVFEDGYRHGAILLALAGLFGGRAWQWSDHALRVLLLCLLYPVFSALMVVWHEGWGSRASMYLSMLAAVPIFLAVRQFKPDMRWLFWGAALGAVTAGGVALHDTLVMGRGRAGGLMNPIKFGNLALFMGGVALIAMLQATRARSFLTMSVFLLAACLGGLASVLSDTRGGWLAIPVVVLVFATWALPVLGWRRLGLGLVVVVSLGAAALMSNLLGMTDRIMQAWLEWENYSATNRSSVGQRLNMWLLALDMIREAPWLGQGDAAFGLRTEQLHAQGALSFVGDFNHPHNDLLNAWVKHGMVAGISMLIALLAPAFWFWHRSRAASQLAWCALAGLLLCVCLLVFGQTQVMLGSKSVTMTYFAWLAALLALSPSHSELSMRGFGMARKMA